MPHFTSGAAGCQRPRTLDPGGGLGRQNSRNSLQNSHRKSSLPKLNFRLHFESILGPFWDHFGMQNVALNKKTMTCIFKGCKSENANTTTLLDLRSSVFINFLIFLAFHLSKHSMLFLAFSVFTHIKQPNRFIVVHFSHFRALEHNFQSFSRNFFSTSISVTILNRKSTQKRSQNGAARRP